MGLSLLQVSQLSLGVPQGNGVLALTEKVSFKLSEGEIFALVGESGCGKSITALALMGYFPGKSGKALEGEVLWKGENILLQSEKKWCQLRGAEMAMIFQEPSAAMNPLMTIHRQMAECFTLHQKPIDHNRIEQLLNDVGISDPKRILGSYPHELSGGMLQRVMIAMALLLKPKLLIADEPTTALDVTVQAQVMNILQAMCHDTGTAILLITHNLGLVAQYADRCTVMYAGRLVEEAPVEAFFKNPQHPYSRGLLDALPVAGRANLKPILGQVPLPQNFSAGCRFAPRCSKASEKCVQAPPWESCAEQHSVACHHRMC